MKCDLCPLRVDCLVVKDDCQFFHIEDNELEPHPSEIGFRLADVEVVLLGSQLSLWVDERTFEALLKMRPQISRVNIAPDEDQGYWDPGQDGPGLCIQHKRR